MLILYSFLIGDVGKIQYNYCYDENVIGVNHVTTAIPEDILQGLKVLVIEDDPDSLEVATRLLKHYGAIVHQALNGQEGLEALRHITPDFIICDLSMPVLDGWEFIEEIKKNRPTSVIPTFALTANVMTHHRHRAIESGFYNFMTKPLTPASFMKDLLHLLEDIPGLQERIKK